MIVARAMRPHDASIEATDLAANALPRSLRWPCASSSAAMSRSDCLRPLTGYRDPAQPKRSGFIQGVWRIRETGRVERTRLEENAMLKMIALIGVGTAIAFTPLPTIAQTAPAASAAAATAPTGSHQRQMRHRENMSKERARASAHHMHHMRHNPAPTP